MFLPTGILGGLAYLAERLKAAAARKRPWAGAP
jgi:hypothetical protein